MEAPLILFITLVVALCYVWGVLTMSAATDRLTASADALSASLDALLALPAAEDTSAAVMAVADHLDAMKAVVDTKLA